MQCRSWGTVGRLCLVVAALVLATPWAPAAAQSSVQLVPAPQTNARMCRNRKADTARLADLDVDRLNSTRTVLQDADFFHDQVNPALYMAASAVFRAPGDGAAAGQLARLIQTIGDSKYATRVSKNSTQNLIHTDFLLLMSYGILALDQGGHLDKAARKTLLKYVKRRISISDYTGKFYYRMKACTRGNLGEFRSSPFDCQNHTYGVMHLRMLVGAIEGKRSEINWGEKLYKYAIDDLAPSGAMWREAVRGAYAYTYYPHALGHVMAIGDLDARMGGDLFGYTNKRGQDIHDAAAFYVNSLADPKNPDLMARYVVRNEGVEGRRYSDTPLSLARRDRARTRRSYNEWFPIYRHNFPQSAVTRAFGPVMARAHETSVTYHLGLDTYCLF